MTGRSVHDGLLRVLTSARLRGWAAAGDVTALGGAVGADEARALCAADPARVRGLARFFGRHFYRERIVRLFAAGRRLSRDAGQDPLDVLATPAFEALLDRAELGSVVTADAVATLVEGVVAGRLAAHAWGTALVAYEGALFRAEAGPRQWAPATGAAAVRAATPWVLRLGWDVTGLVAAVRRGDDVLPDPRSAQSAAALARALGTDEAACGRALQQLAAIGAVAWRDA